VRKRWVLRQKDLETSCAYRREFSSLLARSVVRDTTTDGLHELVFGEVVTNAVRHGDEPMCVCVEFDHASLKIVVENAGSCAGLEKIVASPSAEGGRGLLIVRALVSRLDIERTPEVACRITATMPVGAVSPR